MNEGKKFEQDIQASAEAFFCLRLKDAGGWGKDESKRFTINNPCDLLLKKPSSTNLYMLELKSTKGRSISLDRMLEQAERMKRYIDTAIPGFLLNFRDYEKTFWMDILSFLGFYLETDRKSIPIDYLEEMTDLVPQEKKRTRYRYDLGAVFT